MRTRITVAAGIATALSVAAIVGGPAQAARDTTPPTLNTPTTASYVIGGQLAEFDLSGEKFYDVPLTMSWTATDASGVVPYYVVKGYLAGDEPAELQASSATSYTGTANDYSDEFGGGSQDTTNWSVTARDYPGNSTERVVYGVQPTVTQNNGYSSGAGLGPAATPSYTGTWTTSSCACFANGTTSTTTASGARANISVTVSAADGETRFGLVMEKAANRGKFYVRLDGVQVASLDSYSATTKHQVIVWQTKLTTGTHTISVVNRATAGRPRIDLDAVVTN